MHNPGKLESAQAREAPEWAELEKVPGSHATPRWAEPAAPLGEVPSVSVRPRGKRPSLARSLARTLFCTLEPEPGPGIEFPPCNAMDPRKVNELRAFVRMCRQDPSVLHTEEMRFLREWVER